MQPIGVFDSGVGGLSVLKALRQTLPHAGFVYVSDAGHAPYGERDVDHVLARSAAIGRYLVNTHQVQALVVACNTATAAAIVALRERHPNLPIVGTEPALKPAAARSRTGAVGVLATRSTLSSNKFQALLQAQTSQQSPGVRFVLQACDGLAAAIERADTPQIRALCTSYTAALGPLGDAPGAIDTVVLGCTHYAFAKAVLQELLGPKVELIDAGVPVAQRTASLLALRGTHDIALANPDTPAPWVDLLTTGEPITLENAARRWLGGGDPARKVRIE